jgi:CheY-like chemotaxis protein
LAAAAALVPLVLLAAILLVRQGFAEALTEVETWRSDLIQLDVRMPGMGDRDVLAKLRGPPDTAEIPVVFITARKQAPKVAALQAPGAKGVLAEPFHPMLLAGQVREFLS